MNRPLFYSDALKRLLSLTDLERLKTPQAHQARLDLRRMIEFLEQLGNPQQDRPTVHVAGTKGKGSTAALVTSVLAAQGYRVGLYSSPHLHTFRERIRINDALITEHEFALVLEHLWPLMETFNSRGQFAHVTTFELLTAMAFVYFRQRLANFQVIEVGLGGRIDATNVLRAPDVCVITSISKDHIGILGDTLEQIAAEKAGIIKAGATVVVSAQQPEVMNVIEQTVRARGARLLKVNDAYKVRSLEHTIRGQQIKIDGPCQIQQLWMPLLGEFQLENAATVLGVSDALRERGFNIDQTAITLGFQMVSWPCRMEVLQEEPLVVADGAHNSFSAARLRDSVLRFLGFRRTTLIVGMLSDKQMAEIVAQLVLLRPYRIIVTRSRHPRSATPDTIAQAFSSHGISASQAPCTSKAVTLALAHAEVGDLILITGSLFVAAEARETIKGITPELYPDLR